MADAVLLSGDPVSLLGELLKLSNLKEIRLIVIVDKTKLLVFNWEGAK